MCRPTRCRTCGKTTWAGCGQHVDQVRAAVPAGDWCGSQHTPAEEQAEKQAGGAGRGLLSRLLGR